MIFSAVFCQVSEGHQTIYMCRILFIWKGKAKISMLTLKALTSPGSPKKNICWYGSQKLPKNLNIYLRQTETAIFLATKHEKIIMAYGTCNYIIFFHTENTSKQQKRWLLPGIALWKWLWGCLSQFLLLWIWCQCFWGSSED